MKPKSWAIGLLTVTGVWSSAITLSNDVRQDGTHAVLAALVTQPMHTAQGLVDALVFWALIGLAPGIAAGIIYLLTRRHNPAIYVWTTITCLPMALMTYGHTRKALGL